MNICYLAHQNRALSPVDLTPSCHGCRHTHTHTHPRTHAHTHTQTLSLTHSHFAHKGKTPNHGRLKCWESCHHHHYQHHYHHCHHHPHHYHYHHDDKVRTSHIRARLSTMSVSIFGKAVASSDANTDMFACPVVVAMMMC